MDQLPRREFGTVMILRLDSPDEDDESGRCDPTAFYTAEEEVPTSQFATPRGEIRSIGTYIQCEIDAEDYRSIEDEESKEPSYAPPQGSVSSTSFSPTLVPSEDPKTARGSPAGFSTFEDRVSIDLLHSLLSSFSAGEETALVLVFMIPLRKRGSMLYNRLWENAYLEFTDDHTRLALKLLSTDRTTGDRIFSLVIPRMSFAAHRCFSLTDGCGDWDGTYAIVDDVCPCPSDSESLTALAASTSATTAGAPSCIAAAPLCSQSDLLTHSNSLSISSSPPESSVWCLRDGMLMRGRGMLEIGIDLAIDEDAPLPKDAYLAYWDEVSGWWGHRPVTPQMRIPYRRTIINIFSETKGRMTQDLQILSPGSYVIDAKLTLRSAF